MRSEDDRLDLMARIIEAGTADGHSFTGMDLDAHREALGRDFSELEDLVEVERMLEAYMEPPDSVRLPRDLGAYRLTRELGRGGMGVVYEAFHRDTEQRVAVKVLRLGYVGRADARTRFRREAHALARVRHPNIVDFLEAGESDEQPFYVMALIDGMNLDRALEGRASPGEQRVAEGVADIADALQRLHEAGLVHRDVKPSNVVLGEDGCMVLADFGLATGDDFLTVTRTGDALGTPAYMAPEQVLGKNDAVDARSDVYGLGATLYYALTSHAPFEADDAHGLATAILRQRPKAPRSHTPDVSPGLARIALKALEKDAADRYPSAAAMRDDLRAFAAGRDVRGRPVSALGRGLRTAHKIRIPLACILAALGLAALLGLAGVFDANGPDLVASVPVAPDPVGPAPVAPDPVAPDPVAVAPDPDVPPVRSHGNGLALPGKGQLYHGVFPGDDEDVDDAEENAITPDTLESYEQAVGKSAAWVYFSHNWYQGRTFPLGTATWIRNHGSVPFIRLMLRSSWEQDVREPLFTPARIAAGEFDADLTAWGKSAAAFGTPLLVEYGTTVNGSWYPWNGLHNGGASVGPNAFRRAFRHIVQTISAAGASNVTWVFHVDAYDQPDEAWNRFENYYPGDDVVDWVGVSVFGAGSPTEDEWTEFATVMHEVYPRLVTMAPGKPLAVLEFAASGGNPRGSAAAWASAALASMKAGTWPKLIGFSWWNESWPNDDDSEHDTDMRVQSVPGLAAALAAGLASPEVLGAPILGR